MAGARPLPAPRAGGFSRPPEARPGRSKHRSRAAGGGPARLPGSAVPGAGPLPTAAAPASLSPARRARPPFPRSYLRRRRGAAVEVGQAVHAGGQLLRHHLPARSVERLGFVHGHGGARTAAARPLLAHRRARPAHPLGQMGAQRLTDSPAIQCTLAAAAPPRPAPLPSFYWPV